MRKASLLVMVVAVAIGGLLFARELRVTPLPDSARSPEQFARYADAVLPGLMSRFHVPAACVGLVSREGRFLRCNGVTRSANGQEVTGSSRFAVASVSKTFTALAVLSLAGSGAIGLDDPAERHLRSWRFPPGPYSGSAVTVRHLLTHTAGVGVGSYGGVGSPAASETTRDVLNGVGRGRPPVTLIAAPGSGFRYSGGGYMVLQQLVEDVSGLPFERVVSERVFQPLGMLDSSFSWGAARRSDAIGHDVAGRALAAHPYGRAMAPGGMVTTGADMVRFTSAFASSRLGTVLGWPEGMWQQYLAPGQGHYALGLTISDANGHRLFGHSGTTMGYDAGFLAVPAEGSGWFVLANGNGAIFLKGELDRLFLEWKTGSDDPRHGVLRLMRAATSFLAVVLATLGAVLLGSFAAGAAGARRQWVGTAGLSARAALGIGLALALAGFVAFWILVFHTEVFYPAVTAAWMPLEFRYVTLGVVLLAAGATLRSLFPLRLLFGTQPATSSRQEEHSRGRQAT